MAEIDTLVDESALAAYMTNELGDTERLALELIEPGNANETLHISRGEEELILRCPPLGKPVPGLLHDLLHEHEALDALSDTWVPTPEVVVACENTSVIGEEFYVMERLDGDVLHDDPPERFQTPAYRQTVGTEIIDTLSKLHNVDFERVGLTAFDDPADFNARQVETILDHIEWTQERTAAVRELPVLFEVGNWLVDNAPEPHAHTLVHGDYKPDNLVFAPGTPPRISGVLDWEMWTVGDPLTDLGWLLSYWKDKSDPSPVTDDLRDVHGDNDLFEILDGYVENYASFMLHDDYPSRRELVARYEAQTGIEYTNDRFYRALGAFKLGAIMDGFYRMVLEDAPSSKESHVTMELLPALLAQQAKLIIDGKTPL